MLPGVGQYWTLILPHGRISLTSQDLHQSVWSTIACMVMGILMMWMCIAGSAYKNQWQPLGVNSFCGVLSPVYTGKLQINNYLLHVIPVFTQLTHAHPTMHYIQPNIYLTYQKILCLSNSVHIGTAQHVHERDCTASLQPVMVDVYWAHATVLCCLVECKSGEDMSY